MSDHHNHVAAQLFGLFHDGLIHQIGRDMVRREVHSRRLGTILKLAQQRGSMLLILGLVVLHAVQQLFSVRRRRGEGDIRLHYKTCNSGAQLFGEFDAAIHGTVRQFGAINRNKKVLVHRSPETVT